MLTEEQKACNYITMRHIEKVRNYINKVIMNLLRRGEAHDQSKLVSPEVELFTEFTPKLASTTYGSAEYNNYKAQMGVALQHHYANNRHHPEFVEFNEVWMDIKNYEGLYQISNRGRIKKCDKTVIGEKQANFEIKGQILKPHVTPKGYARIQLSKNNEKENVFIHTLVAQAFILPDNEEKTQVNHKNGDKLNNNVDNLEWVTPGENLQHAYDNGLKNAAVKYVVTCNELNITTFGIEKMVNKLHDLGYNKVCSPGIWACISENGKAKSHAGFTFSSINLQDYKELNSPINDMTLIDLIEMLVDWKAASERHNDGNILKSIEINGTRFEMSPQLIRICENTAKELF